MFRQKRGVHLRTTLHRIWGLGYPVIEHHAKAKFHTGTNTYMRRPGYSGVHGQLRPEVDHFVSARWNLWS